MLIVEGPDGAGKTTLVKRLSAEFSWPIADRVVSSDTEAMGDLRDWVDRNLQRGFQPKIFDRHRLISEPIYGPVLRDRPNPGFEDAVWLSKRQRLFRSINPVIIWCLPPFEVVRANIECDEANRVVEPFISQIYWLYFNAMATWPGTHSYRYDYGIDGEDTFVDQVAQSVRRYL